MYDVFYHDGVPYAYQDPIQLTFVNPLQYFPLAFDFGQGLPAQPLVDDPATPRDEGLISRLHERACPETGEKIGHMQHFYDVEPDYDAFWKERNWVPDAGKLAEPAPGTGQETSALVIGSWRDQLLRAAPLIRWFEAVPVDNPATGNDEGVPFKMLVMDKESHGGIAGSRLPNQPDDPATTWQDESFWGNKLWPLIHAWFDHFLYGHDTNVEKQNPVWTAGNNGLSKNNVEASLREELGWPVPGRETVNLFLRATGALSAKPPREPESLGSYVDTATMTEGEVLNRMDAPGDDFLWFETDPLQADVRIAGQPFLKLFASTSATSTHFTPVLFDIGQPDPNNPADPADAVPFLGPCYPTPVQQEPSELDTSPRLRSSGCVVSRGFLNARYKDGLEQGKDVVPDTPYKATIRFLDDDWTIPAGHRIGLAVMSSNAWWAVPDQQRAVNSLYSERGNRRSVLVLPIVGGKGALEAAFPSPATEAGSDASSELVDLLFDDSDEAIPMTSTSGEMTIAPASITQESGAEAQLFEAIADTDSGVILAINTTDPLLENPLLTDPLAV